MTINLNKLQMDVARAGGHVFFHSQRIHDSRDVVEGILAFLDERFSDYKRRTEDAQVAAALITDISCDLCQTTDRGLYDPAVIPMVKERVVRDFPKLSTNCPALVLSYQQYSESDQDIDNGIDTVRFELRITDEDDQWSPASRLLSLLPVRRSLFTTLAGAVGRGEISREDMVAQVSMGISDRTTYLIPTSVAAVSERRDKIDELARAGYEMDEKRFAMLACLPDANVCMNPGEPKTRKTVASVPFAAFAWGDNEALAHAVIAALEAGVDKNRVFRYVADGTIADCYEAHMSHGIPMSDLMLV